MPSMKYLNAMRSNTIYPLCLTVLWGAVSFTFAAPGAMAQARVMTPAVTPAVGAVATPPPVIPADAPKVIFEKPLLEFGELNEGDVKKFTTKVGNGGRSELNITQVSGTCGCTSVSLAKKKLAPGEWTELSGAFESLGHPGQQTKLINISSNDPATPVAHVEFSVNVVPLVSFEPKYLNFGQIYGDTATSRTVVLKSRVPMQVKSVSLDKPGQMRADVLSSDAMSSGGAVVAISTVPGIPAQQLNGSISIMTDRAVQPIQRLVYIGQILAELTATPQVCWLGRVNAGDVVTREIKLSDRGGKPVHVTGVDGVGLKIDWSLGTQAADGSVMLTLRVTAPVMTGETLQREISITTDNPKYPRFPLTVFAQYTLPGGAQPAAVRPAPPAIPTPIATPGNAKPAMAAGASAMRGGAVAQPSSGR